MNQDALPSLGALSCYLPLGKTCMDDVHQYRRSEVLKCNLGYNFRAFVRRPCAELM